MDDVDFTLLQRTSLLNDDAFAQRVINYATAQKRPPRLIDQLRDFWAELSEPVHIPRPAYVLACLALFGFLIGALAQSDSPIAVNPTAIFYDTGEMI